MPRTDLSDYGLLAAVVSTCTLVQRYEQLPTGTPNPPPRIGLPCTTLVIGKVGPAIAEEILVAMVSHQCDAIAKRSFSFFPNGLADQGIDRDHDAACVRGGPTLDRPRSHIPMAAFVSAAWVPGSGRKPLSEGSRIEETR